MGEQSPSQPSTHTHSRPQSPQPDTHILIPPESSDVCINSAGFPGSIVSSTTIDAQRITELGNVSSLPSKIPLRPRKIRKLTHDGDAAGEHCKAKDIPSETTSPLATSGKPATKGKLSQSRAITVPRIQARPLTCEGELDAAIHHLRNADKLLAALIDVHPPPSFESFPTPFLALIRNILYQQLAAKAGNSIYTRFVGLCGGEHVVVPETVLALNPQQLRQIGVSGRKASYVHDLARKYQNGILSDSAIVNMDDKSLFTMLTMVNGIGSWSVHMFMINSLHRPDVLPVNDLGVRKGVQMLYNLEDLPRPSQMEQLCVKWRPYRSVASWYMWRLIEAKGTPTSTVASRVMSLPPLEDTEQQEHQQQQQSQQLLDPLSVFSIGDESISGREEKASKSCARLRREWRHFIYKAKSFGFYNEAGKGCEPKDINIQTLPQFSSARAPKVKIHDDESSSFGEPIKDFVMHVGGSVWALEWCPRVHGNPDAQAKCEFLAVATHPPESCSHKIGVRLSGRGIIQIWCIINTTCENDSAHMSAKNQKSTEKSRKKPSHESINKTEPKKPRGRPRKNPIETTEPKKARGRPRKKSTAELPIKLDGDVLYVEALSVRYPEESVALWKFSTSKSSEDSRPLLFFSADTAPIRAVAWAPGESDQESANVVATAGHGGLKFWDLRDPFRPLWDLHPVPRFIYSLDWLQDPKCVLLSFDDGTIRILSLVKVAYDVPATGKPYPNTKQQGLSVYNCSSFPIWSIQVSRLTAYCTADGSVFHFQLKTKAVEKDSRNRTPHFLCGRFTMSDSTFTVHRPVPNIPIILKKPVGETGEKQRCLRSLLNESPNRYASPVSDVQRLAFAHDEDLGLESETEGTNNKASKSEAKKGKNNTTEEDEDRRALVCVKDGDEGTRKEASNASSGAKAEGFPSKMVAMHRVRWNMNKGSERLLCYGGAAGIVRCQEVAPSGLVGKPNWRPQR